MNGKETALSPELVAAVRKAWLQNRPMQHQQMFGGYNYNPVEQAIASDEMAPGQPSMEKIYRKHQEWDLANQAFGEQMKADSAAARRLTPEEVKKDWMEIGKNLGIFAATQAIPAGVIGKAVVPYARNILKYGKLVKPMRIPSPITNPARLLNKGPMHIPDPVIGRALNKTAGYKRSEYLEAMKKLHGRM